MDTTPAKPTYRIRDWADHFENSESRKVKHARYVCLPNKQDGKTFRRIARHSRAAEIYCAWCLILEVASKMPERGVLADTDGPLDADDLADKTGFQSCIFDIALKVLSTPKFGWICSDCNPDDLPELPDEPPESPGNCPNLPEPPRVPGSFGTRREGNRREQKGTETFPAVAGTSSNGGPRSSPKPEHRAVIEHYFRIFKARYGAEPTFRDGRDGKHVKRILDAVQRDEGKAKGILDAFLADDDPWLLKGRHSLGQLVSALDRFRIPVPVGAGDGYDEPAEFTADKREIAFRKGGDE